MLNIKVLSHETILEVVYYEIEIKEEKETWVINSRYRELSDIHEEFKKLNKKKGFPKFPAKKFFGGNSPLFLDERQNALDTYFTNIIKYNKKLNYNLTPWINFFRENKKSAEEKQENKSMEKNSLTKEERSIVLTDLTENEKSQTNPMEALNEISRKKIIYINNNLLEGSGIRDNLFFIENDFKNYSKDKKLEGDDSKFLMDCLDFCSHFDEQFLFDEIETQKLLKNEFIYFFK
jgi:hypothetical protein